MKLIATMIVITVFGALLSACASPPQRPEELASTHGLLQVVVPKVLQPAPLTVRSVSGNTSYRLLPDPADPAVMALWLPPGEYRLSRWVDTGLDGYPSIEVNAGRITSMGALLPVALGGKEMTLLPVDTPEVARSEQQAVDRLRPYLRTQEVSRWRSPELPKRFTIDPGYTGLGLVADLISLYIQHVNQAPVSKRLREARNSAEMLSIAKQAAAPITKEPALDSAGNLYYGANLGQIRVRSPKGEWSALDTGSIRPISAVEWKDGLLLAGTEGGEIRASRDGGATWNSVAHLGAQRAITDIDWVGSRWVVLSAGYRQRNYLIHIIDRIALHVASSDDFNDLHQIWETSVDDVYLVAPNWNGVRGEGTSKWYLFPAFHTLAKLNTGTWLVTPGTREFLATGVHVFPGSRTVTAFAALGAFSKVYVSSDEGDTWTRLPEPSLIIDEVVFETPERGITARWPMAAFTPNLVLESYDPSTKTWQSKEQAPLACRGVLHDGSNLPNLCVTGGGSILRRTDAGWGIEFSAE